jgi:hypothetical protein
MGGLGYVAYPSPPYYSGGGAGAEHGAYRREPDQQITQVGGGMHAAARPYAVRGGGSMDDNAGFYTQKGYQLKNRPAVTGAMEYDLEGMGYAPPED